MGEASQPATHASGLLDPASARAAIADALERVGGGVRRTPVMTSRRLDARYGRRIVFKCEPFQTTGAFKARGAFNAVFSLSPEARARGVVTHSSGNHAGAVAAAAAAAGVPAYVVLPEGAPEAKARAVAGYGARITRCAPTLAARAEAAEAIARETGAAFIHPYDDDAVIAGQATCAVELIEEIGDLDAILCPVGGGGLLSGTALAARWLSPRTKVFGGEPEGAAYMAASLAAGRPVPQAAPDTIADGLRAAPSARTVAVARDVAAGVLTVTDAEIVSAMRALWETLKVVVEPSGAAALALLERARPEIPGERIGIILTGGNLDLDALPWSAGR